MTTKLHHDASWKIIENTHVFPDHMAPRESIDQAVRYICNGPTFASHLSGNVATNGYKNNLCVLVQAHIR